MNYARAAAAAIALAVAAAAAALPPAARLDIDVAGATFAVTVGRGGATAPGRLAIDCIAACRTPVHYAEAADDTVLGVFRLWDGDGLVYTVWAAGSVYRVRAYLLAATGARRVLDAATRGAPSFSLDAAGRAVVGTTERGDRDGPDAPLHHVSWTWHDGRFVRTAL